MKKFLKAFVLLVFIMVPIRVHAGGGASASAILTYLTAIDGPFQYAQMTEAIASALSAASTVINTYDTVKNTYDTVKNTYDQFQKMVEAEKRAINNLKGILNARSFDDFMNWTNRQLYLEREAEARFNALGVKIGRKNYKIADIDKIPDALRNEFGDKFDGDFTEEEKRNMWVSLGLTPGNYMYLKTWEERNDRIAKKILTYSDIYADEHEEAVARNNDLIGKYSSENEQLDINEITKDSNLIAMNQEMVLRELLRLQIEMHEYQLSKDKMNEPAFNPPRLSDTWGYDPWEPITNGGFSQDKYESF